MKLGVATACLHGYYEGRWWSYEPYVLEMNIWGELFEELVIVAPIKEGPPPEFSAPYAPSTNLSVIPYRRLSARQKTQGKEQPFTSPWEIPRMIGALLQALPRTDAFHLRSPGSIALVASIILPPLKRRLCAKYAGQWTGYPEEARSYRIQRAILKSRWWHGPVTVYGRWPNQPRHIVPFFTSVLNQEQIARARKAANRERSDTRVRILFVGRLAAAKNVDILLRALAPLKARGLDFECSIVGGGPERESLEQLTRELDLEDSVRFTGAVDFTEVLDFYEQSDVLVLASETEGWPKAIAEGMAFGLICIGSNRGLVPEMLGEGRGLLVPPRDLDALTVTLQKVVEAPGEYSAMRSNAAAWAQNYSLEGLKTALAELLSRWWGTSIGQ